MPGVSKYRWRQGVAVTLYDMLPRLANDPKVKWSWREKHIARLSDANIV